MPRIRDAQRYRKIYSYYRPVPREEFSGVDESVIQGLDWKQSVKVASTSDLGFYPASLPSESSPGSGVGFVLDGVTLQNEDRILLKDQTNPAENGIYLYFESNYYSTYYFKRALDAEQDTLTCGAAVYVEDGTNANSGYFLTTQDPITVGTDALTWVKFTGGASIFTTHSSPSNEGKTIYGLSIDTDNRYPSDIGSDVYFYVSGTISGSRKAVFGGDVKVSGSVYFDNDILLYKSGSFVLVKNDYIKDQGMIFGSTGLLEIDVSSLSSLDLTTEQLRYKSIRFTGTPLSNFIANVSSLSGTPPDGQTICFFNSTADVIYVSDSDYLIPVEPGRETALTWSSEVDHLVLSRGEPDQVLYSPSNTGGELLYWSGSWSSLAIGSENQVLTVSSSYPAWKNLTSGGGGDQYFTSSVNGSIYTTGSTAFSGQEGITSPSQKGSDVFFYVSGSLDSSNVSLFGGSVVISGSLNQGNLNAATGEFSHAQGYSTLASGFASHAEGGGAWAKGDYSHAEGSNTTSNSDYSHAEGNSTSADGVYSHAEGYYSITYGSGSHAEGLQTTASGDYSHSEGESTTASGPLSHAEGYGTVAQGSESHAEGRSTGASGIASHAEGFSSYAYGTFSHAEGNQTQASGDMSHTEGYLTIANSSGSHAEGRSTLADGEYSHAAGYGSITSGSYSYAGGLYTIASGSGQTVVGQYNTRDNLTSLFVVGNGTGDDNANRSDVVRIESSGLQVTGSIIASGGLSGSLTALADGTPYIVAGPGIEINTGSNGSIQITGSATIDQYFFSPSTNNLYTTGSVAFNGGGTSIPSDFGSDIFFYVSGSINDSGTNAKKSVFGGDVRISGSFSQGSDTTASGLYSHAEGNLTTASGFYSHAEGYDAVASGWGSHAEGESTRALANDSHAEGFSTRAEGDYSHAEGDSTIAKGTSSHAEGQGSISLGQSSHAGGEYTIASGSAQTVVGKYNKRNNDFSLFVVGNGTGDDDVNRSDLLRADVSSLQVTGSLLVTGSAEITNTLYVGSDITSDGNVYALSGSFTSGLYVSGSGIYVPAGGMLIDGDSLEIGGDLIVSGTTTLNRLYITGSGLTMTGSLSISGSVDISSTLFVSSTITAGGNILPTVDSVNTLGSPSYRWAHVYTGDLHLKNERGDWTVIEEEDFLTLRNNKTGKRFKIAMIPMEED